MLKNYYEELHDGKSVIYDDHGFATYWIRGEEVYIEDIYVKKEYRRTHAASQFADKVAKLGIENGCTYMTGTVVPSANNSTISMKMMIGYGFDLWIAQDDIIWFKKALIDSAPNAQKGERE